MWRFLESETIKNIPQSELEVIFRYPLLSPSFKEQEEIIESIQYLFIFPENLSRRNLIKYSIFMLILEELRKNRILFFTSILLKSLKSKITEIERLKNYL